MIGVTKKEKENLYMTIDHLGLHRFGFSFPSQAVHKFI